MIHHVHRVNKEQYFLSYHGLIKLLAKHTLERENHAWEDFVGLPLPVLEKPATPEKEMREVTTHIIGLG